MSKLCIYKDVGFGDERKIDLTIDLDSSGKTDSVVRTRLVGKDVPNEKSCTTEGDIFHIHVCRKFDKKSITSEKGEELSVSYYPFFYEELLDPSGSIWKKISKCIALGYQDLIVCDLLFIGICLDACDRTCKTVFPWQIGGATTASLQQTMLSIVSSRKDFNTKGTKGKDIAANAAKYTGAAVYGSAGLGVAYTAGGVLTMAAADGMVTAAGMATSAGVVASAASSSAAALAGGAGAVGALSAGATTLEAGAAAASAFGGVTMGVVAAPVTIAAAAIGLTAMCFKFGNSALKNIIVKDPVRTIAKYSELVQRGNLGMYCAKNELRFNEIWTELAEKSEILGANDIFDLEEKIAELL